MATSNGWDVVETSVPATCSNCGEERVCAAAPWDADAPLCAACWESASRHGHVHVHRQVSRVGCVECWADACERARAFGEAEPVPAGYVGPQLGHEPCSRCGGEAPVYARADQPDYRETVCACEVGPPEFEDEQEHCEECGAVLAGMFEGPLCRACDEGSAQPCDDCARSYGPHYGGCRC